MKKNLWLLALASLLGSCAGSFKSIDPTTIHYNTQAEKSDVDLQYKYDVLRERGNKKYAKKELKAGVRIVALRITNTSDKTIRIGDNARIYSGDSEVRLWPADLIHRRVKQIAPLYLLYLLLTPLEISTSSNGVETSSFPIGYIVGPGLAAGNVAVAATGNARLKQELMNFDLIDKPIAPGQTVYGLIGVPESGFIPLRIVVKP
jgi:hypothetical protein